jgi:ferric-chelate reductase (NADPH)
MGRVERAVLSLFTRQARVGGLRQVAERFTLVTLRGDSLRGVSWLPGQKVELPLGGWTKRTFTPISWDATAGSTELLVYAHGEGPVARWVGGLAPGAACSMFGPRGSLDLGATERPALVFGDETSFGLAHALRFTPRGAEGAALLFEVTSRDASERALGAVGITDAVLVERQPGDAHLGALEKAAERLVGERSIRAAVLSGKAASIGTLGRRLKALGLPRAEIRTKAYWSPGKTGLD